ESELTAFNAAADAALSLGRPLDKVNDTARALIDWASSQYCIDSNRQRIDLRHLRDTRGSAGGDDGEAGEGRFVPALSHVIDPGECLSHFGDVCAGFRSEGKRRCQGAFQRLLLQLRVILV